MKQLTPTSRPDNYLIEMELAVKYNRKNQIAIYPLLVGTTQADGSYKKFDPNTFRLEGIPETKSPTSDASVKSTLQQLFKFQGIWLNSSTTSEEVITDILKWCDEFAWNKTSRNSMKV
jgi:hypothetical protein